MYHLRNEELTKTVHFLPFNEISHQVNLKSRLTFQFTLVQPEKIILGHADMFLAHRALKGYHGKNFG